MLQFITVSNVTKHFVLIFYIFDMSYNLQGSVFLRQRQSQCEMRDVRFDTLTEINKSGTQQFSVNKNGFRKQNHNGRKYSLPLKSLQDLWVYIKTTGLIFVHNKTWESLLCCI